MKAVLLYSLALDAGETVRVVRLAHCLGQHPINVPMALGAFDPIQLLIVLFAVVGVVLDKVPS